MANLKLRNENTSKKIEKYVEESIQEAFLPPVPFIIGKKYAIRSLTMINIGKLVSIVGRFLVLDDASWIASAGRWEECLTKPEGIKVSEKFKDPVFIHVDNIIDATIWRLSLPEKSIDNKGVN